MGIPNNHIFMIMRINYPTQRSPPGLATVTMGSLTGLIDPSSYYSRESPFVVLNCNPKPQTKQAGRIGPPFELPGTIVDSQDTYN